MSDRQVLEPTAEHPITVEPTDGHVTVRFDGVIIAETDRALTLREAAYPAVQYIPLEDVDSERLRPSDTHTYCPFKGEADYYHVVDAGGHTVDDVIWTYPHPYPAVERIAGHVAFYPDKAEVVLRRAGA